MAKKISKLEVSKARIRSDVPALKAFKVIVPDGRNGQWVVKKLDKSKMTSSKTSAGVVSKRLQDANGKTLVYRIVDANGATFSADFDSVFRSNVRKARRANKLVAGTPTRGLPES